MLDVAAVVAAHEHRFPLLPWGLLAMRWQEGTVDVEVLLRGHPLQSARTLVTAFVDSLCSTAADSSPESEEEDESLPSLPALISRRHSFAPVVMEQRFHTRGWREAGRVQSPCPRCAATPSVAYYRPRDDQDQPYELWYQLNWALFCTECALLSEPSQPELLRAEWNRGTFRRART
jgi:hypothetical protein